MKFANLSCAIRRSVANRPLYLSRDKFPHTMHPRHSMPRINTHSSGQIQKNVILYNSEAALNEAMFRVIASQRLPHTCFIKVLYRS